VSCTASNSAGSARASSFISIISKDKY